MATVEELLNIAKNRFSETVSCVMQYDQLTLELDPSDLILCAKILRDEQEFKFEQLIDICAVDYLHYGMDEWATNTSTSEGFSRGREKLTNNDCKKRFAVIYNLLSITHNHRIRLKVFARGEPLHVPSITSIWASANWYEREAFDLFGIYFEGHPDLRRILTDYGFIGHPFRKDFPLIGQVEMRYDAAAAKVIYEPVSIKPRNLVPKVIRHKQRNGQDA